MGSIIGYISSSTFSMVYKKFIGFSLVLMLFALPLFAQKMVSDGSVIYAVSVIKGKDNQAIADAFDGATLTVAFKGAMARTDLKSTLRQQTVFYNSKDGSAVILKESGAEKYMINLTPAQWQQYNRKFDGVKFTNGADTKIIQGVNCQKATGTLKDGSVIEVYYATDLKPIASGYEYAFKDLPGLPLQYEITMGNIVVRYTATSLQSVPVSSSTFDLPKAGYKLLDFKQ